MNLAMSVLKTACISLAVGFMASSSVAQTNPLADSSWAPSEINNRQFTPNSRVYLEFDGNNTYSGNSGCNRFSGQFSVNGSSIFLGPAAATRMACPGSVSTDESEFLNALMSASTFRRDGMSLKLMNAGGGVVLKFELKN